MMTRDEAIAEAKRYLAYNDAMEKQANDLAKLASLRRAGASMDDVKDRLLTTMAPKVYDGAKLIEAIRVLIKESNKL